MRICIVAFLLLLGACGGDDEAETPSEPESEFLDRWPEIPEGPELEGHPTRVDEEQRVLYVDDCEVAKRATSESGEYGPEERDPVTQESEPGYGYICPSAGQ